MPGDQKLKLMAVLRQRLLDSERAGSALATWEALSVSSRLAGMAIVASLLAVIIVAALALFSADGWAGKLAGLSAGAAVLYAGYQVRLTRVIAKQTLAYQYFARFSELSLTKTYERAKAFSIPRPSGKAAEEVRWREYQDWAKNDPAKKRDILFVFNFFEELGGLYKRGVVDRRIVNEYLGAFALAFRNELGWFFARQERSTLFEDWKAMCQAVQDARARKKRLEEKLAR